jgi:hypothetical protein
MKYLPWILAIVGGWLIAAPFLLDDAGTEAAKNNVGVGMLMVLGALVWGILGFAPPWTEHRHACPDR